jgi:hypothetical protein
LDDAGLAGLDSLQIASENSPSVVQAAVDARAAALSRLKSDVLYSVLNQDVEIIRDYSHLPMVFARVRSADGLMSILSNPGIVGVYEDRKEKPFLSVALPFIGQPPVAASGKVGAGTTVAVLDTRIEYTRPEFGSCTSPGVPSSCRVVAALDVASPPSTDRSHGTNVAAIVAAVAPGTHIASLNVFGSDGQATDSDVITAINSAIANKAAFNVVAINLSLGSNSTNSTPCSNSVFTAPISNARAAGIITVAAAGNDGKAYFLAEPACVPKAVSVGAVYDQNFGPSSWTENPPCTDPSTGPDQVTCFSNDAQILTMFAPGAPITAGGYTFVGTSQATPFVAGSIAVLRSAFQSDSLPQTIERLVGNAVQIVDPRSGYPKPRLNLLSAVSPPSWGCNLQPISLPGTATGVLLSNSCHALDANYVFYADVYSFVGTAGQHVTINLNSNLFNTYLALVPPSGAATGTAVATSDSAEGSTLNSSISFTLTESGTWEIDVESSFPYVTGSYLLSVTAGTQPPPPVAGFNFSPSSPMAGQTVSFTDVSSGSPTSWSWNFGDPASGASNTSAAQNPSHTFATEGTYTVTLTASNAGGSSQASFPVVVAAATQGCFHCVRVVPFKTPR